MHKTLVCEKTDGMRFLLLEILIGRQLMVFLVDRQYNFRMVSHFHTTTPNPYLPEGTNLSKVMIANFFDGELVVDSPWRKESLAPIFLIFDALIVNTSNVIGEPFNLRLKTAHDYIARRFLPARSLPGK